MEITFKSDFDVELIDSMGSDLRICQAAWVSTEGELSKELPADKDPSKLIPYLMKHRHGSPFEHNSMEFFTRCPIKVYREWHRHRVGFSYNEESARYKTLDPVFYLPPRHRPMFKVDDWKPGRPKFTTIEDENKKDTGANVLQPGEDAYQKLRSNLSYSAKIAYGLYLDNLSMNFDPGLARDCLPVNIYSSQWVNLNARSMMNFLSLRVHDPEAKFVSYPLWEINQVALQLEAHFAKLFPITYKAFCDNGRVAP